MLPYIHIGNILLPSYGVCMITGIVLAFFVAYFRLPSINRKFDTLLLIGAVALMSGLLLSSITYYIVSYGVDRLISELSTGDFSGLTNVGLVFYGGVIGGIFGAYIAIKLNHLDVALICDALVPSIPLGHAFGRLGCTLAGCCYGVPYEGFGAIHSVFVGDDISLFPVQLLECFLNIVLFIVLITFPKHYLRPYRKLALYFLLYGLIRFLLEFLRGDTIRGIYLGMSTSQWISIVLFFVGIVLLINPFATNKLKKEHGKA